MRAWGWAVFAINVVAVVLASAAGDHFFMVANSFCAGLTLGTVTTA